ncbi:MAG: DNA-binding protein, partial [Gammaproteobacteria bacterium]|nr:DNA-binding protein [Gammaproteobacteria bacterium]
MIRVFLDANVLFTAAHNPSGKAALIIQLGTKGYWKVVTSAYAIEEARHNLAIKFPNDLPTLGSVINNVAQVPSGTGVACPVDLPKKDRPILQAAIQSKSTHLLTGDIKDFGPYMNQPGLTVG